MTLFNFRLDGYYGEFKTASSSGAEENVVTFVNVGDDFTMDFGTNQEVLDATFIEENTNFDNIA